MTGFIHWASSPMSEVVRRLIRQRRTLLPISLRASLLTAGRNALNMLVPSRVGAFLARKVYPWVALDPASEDNGCLRFIDASHHELLDHKPVPGAPYHLVPDATALDMSQESVVPAGKGSVIVIHSQALHGSAANHSSQWRRAYSCHRVTDRVTCATSAPAYGYSRTVGQEPYPHRSP